jgi:hypothetical protein
MQLNLSQDEAFDAELDEALGLKPKANGGANGHQQPIIKTAAALQTMEFAPLKYVVPDLVVEGCVLLAGKPKIGKSWMALDIGLAVAGGRLCLGERKPIQGDVLYLALEDGDRRLQRRMTKLLPTFGGKWPEKFEYATHWLRADESGVEAIDTWCAEHPAARLIVVDILAKFRAPSRGKSNVYEQDYAALSKLQELATQRSVTILVLHHTRKGESEDAVEEISGTLGLSGAADAFLVLKRASAGATLTGRGRDTEDADLAVAFNRDTCRWTILGAAAEVHQSDERGRVLVALEGADQGLSVSEIIAAAQLTNRIAADALLYRMSKDGKIERIKRGLYGLPGTISKIQRQMRQKVRSEPKPLKSQEDEPRSDDLTHLMQVSSEAPEEREPAPSCAQCTMDDAPLWRLTQQDGSEVWLHSECEKSWFAENPQNSVVALVCISEVKQPKRHVVEEIRAQGRLNEGR